MFLISIQPYEIHLNGNHKMFHESEEKLQLSLEEGPMGMSIFSHDFKLIEVNKTLCKMFRYSKDELVGKSFSDITYPEDIEEDKALAEKLFNGEIPIYTIEKRFVTKHGDLVWVNLIATIIFGNGEIPSLGLGIFEDISQQFNSSQEAIIEETQDHARRAAEIVIDLSRKMDVNEDEIVHIYRGALLHDIGKMALPSSILLKKDPLTDDEWEIIRQHPVYAYQMLAPIKHLQKALDIPLYHHEKWDGTGYPRGLKGSHIPLAARIFAVVDVWDALLSDRSYRKSWSEADAISYIRDQSGKHFDPQIADVFLKMVEGI